MVAIAQQKDVPVEVTAIGNVEAFSTVSVKSMVNGEITAVHFQEGQDVRKGQLLFSIDRRPFEAELHRLEGNLAKDSAQAQNAVVQARRYQALFKEGVVAREQYDQVQSNAEAMQAGVLAGIKRCIGSWCRIVGPGFDGWTLQEQLWGVYPNEKVE